MQPSESHWAAWYCFNREDKALQNNHEVFVLKSEHGMTQGQ